jgi:hypothetical protein
LWGRALHDGKWDSLSDIFFFDGTRCLFDSRVSSAYDSAFSRFRGSSASLCYGKMRPLFPSMSFKD